MTATVTRARWGALGAVCVGLGAVCVGLGATVQAAPPPGPPEPSVAVTVPVAVALGREELLTMLRAVPGVTAKYREEQHIALLTAPLVSRGTMHFAPPGRLAKHQSEPAIARTVVADGRLAFADAYGRDELELAKNPVVSLFVDSFLSVLAGDVEAIERAWYVGYAAETEGDPRAWVLTLRPRGEATARLVEHLSIRGREAVVSRIEIIERGGDRTVTTLSDVDVARRWGADELAQVFSVATPR
ncbi:MAG: outer membrane lipoprotein carrier protein LolA [Myxococcales bacterium]|nr:outer membrane lipoprotein carrier protein LolA [Myxococcales bacterium]